MTHDRERQKAHLQAFALDWLIWTYVPAAITYFFREELADSGISLWLYLAGIVLGAVLAAVLEHSGNTLGHRIVGLIPETPIEQRGMTRRAPWYQTQIGWTAAIVGVVTFVLGWRVTEINLYYVFTRADKMTNMTDRLFRPYWPVIGSLIEKMIETIFLALMATVISIPLAAVISFFAARNIMYRISGKRGVLMGGFVCGVLGAWLGTWLVQTLLAPLEGGILDVKLIKGVLSPIALLAGLLVCGYYGSLLMSRLLDGKQPLARAYSVVLEVIFGIGGAYVIASLVSMVIFGASWRIFVRDYGVWPYVVLAAGAVVGFLMGLRHQPDSAYAVGPLIYDIVRFILNGTRSIEPFVWALIFVTWFRLGPFPGMVALMVHSVAALGKLYSEADREHRARPAGGRARVWRQ